MKSIIKTGCCGFSAAMRIYFEKFSLIEVQKTFYKPPRIETARKWRESAPQEFEFTVKAWQVITHLPSSLTYRKASITSAHGGFFKPVKEVFEAWERTKGIASALRSRIILFQTPPSFKENAENMENMSNFFSSIEREFIFVWEPRGWGDSAVRSICEKLDLVHCTDPFIAKPVYGNIAYFRLHGSHTRMYEHKYSDEELVWFKDYCASLDKEVVYVLFNNVYMFEDAARFMAVLNQGI